MQDEAECSKQFKLAPKIAEYLGTSRVSLLPRKIGISQDEGFRSLQRIWKETGHAFEHGGITVCAENHVWAPNADGDIFLLRAEADFHRLIDITDGGIKVKLDPVWLLKPNAGEQPIPAFRRLLPHVAVLDLKDCTVPEGALVPPGAGDVDFEALGRLTDDSHIGHLSVEAEHHMEQKPPISDQEAIDAVHISALNFYKGIFARDTQ